MTEVLKFVKFDNLSYFYVMGRKSLAAERTAEILDAFERCIDKYGLEGTSLDQIATEAGVQRSLIRHYIGNREAVVAALIERIMAGYKQQTEALLTFIEGSKRKQAWLKYLFEPLDEVEARHERIVGELLLTAKARYPQEKAALARTYKELIARLGKVLAQIYPNAGDTLCQETAYAILELSDAASDAYAMGLGKGYPRMARNVAKRLLQTLAEA